MALAFLKDARPCQHMKAGDTKCAKCGIFEEVVGPAGEHGLVAAAPNQDEAKYVWSYANPRMEGWWPSIDASCGYMKLLPARS